MCHARDQPYVPTYVRGYIIHVYELWVMIFVHKVINNKFIIKLRYLFFLYRLQVRDSYMCIKKLKWLITYFFFCKNDHLMHYTRTLILLFEMLLYYQKLFWGQPLYRLYNIFVCPASPLFTLICNSCYLALRQNSNYAAGPGPVFFDSVPFLDTCV